MRTLKKVLALSMVFAMAFSMMAGAAFNDQDKIDASLTEDIQLLTALEVFQGDEKGDFNPTDNVTRAQAAKMIYVLKNNGQDDEAAAFKGTSVYSDVPSGHWAEGYINYATNLGIMSGWTEGSVRKFDPNGNVTGLELTKMLLCMIGYRADIQGYTGSGWQTNVLKDGAASAITTNYLPTIYNAAPRQWTARLMANAINAPYVTYSRGEVVMGHATNPAMSYGQQYLGLRTVEGYLKNAGKVSLPSGIVGETTLDDDGDEIVVCSTYENDGRTMNASKNLDDGDRTFKTTVDPSLLGQHVKVYYKDANTTTKEFKVYAVLATGKSKVYEVAMGDISIGQNDNGETIKFAGYNGGSAKTYTVTSGSSTSAVPAKSVKLIKNLDKITSLTPLVKDTQMNKNGDSVRNFSAFSGNSNEKVRLVDQDNDGFIDLVFTNDVTYAIVSSHNAERNTLRFKDAEDNAMNTLVDNAAVNSESSYKKVNLVNDVAADDVVKVTLDTTSGIKRWNVEKVEPVSATVSGYSLNKNGTAYTNVTINGTSTKFAKNTVKAYSTLTSGSIGSDTTFYSDGAYIVYSKGGNNATSVNNLAYIIDADNSSWMSGSSWYVKALLSDGTQGEYKVSAAYGQNGTKMTSAELSTLLNRESVEGTVLSCSLSNDQITLREVKNGGDVVFHSKKTGSPSFKNSTRSYNSSRVADDAYFFVKTQTPKTGGGWNDPKYSVVRASEVSRDLTGRTGDGGLNKYSYATQTINGVPSVIYGTLDLSSGAVSKAADYAFVKSAATYDTVDGVSTVKMTVALPNAEEAILTKTFDDSNSANLEISTWTGYRGRLIKYALDSNGHVDTIELVTLPNDATSTTVDENFEAEGWYKVVLLGWGSNSAYVVQDNGEEKVDAPVARPKTLTVARDAHIHVVNTTSNDWATLVDGDVVRTNHSVTKTTTDGGTTETENEGYVGASAMIFVQEVNSQWVITEMFTQENGNSINLMWPVAANPAE